jgi:hypothetical protein
MVRFLTSDDRDRDREKGRHGWTVLTTFLLVPIGAWGLHL